MAQRKIGAPKPDRARTLRRNPTEPEKRLWQKLRNRQLSNLKFRRQTPVGPYIADFLCLDALLIVEVDGEAHGSTQARDAVRTAYVENEGFRVIRFSNAEVMGNMDGVLAQILAAAMPSPSRRLPSAGPSNESRASFELSQRERD
jgi:very-short-patch-repair endonuclease